MLEELELMLIESEGVYDGEEDLKYEIFRFNGFELF